MHHFFRYAKDSEANKSSYLVNPVRCVEAFLCVGCFALAIYLVVEIAYLFVPFKVIIAVTAAAFASITIIDIISTSHYDPIFWTSWILIAIAGAVFFMLCVGALLATGTGLLPILIIGEILNGVTAIIFLIDAFYLLNALRKQQSTVSPKDGPTRVYPEDYGEYGEYDYEYYEEYDEEAEEEEAEARRLDIYPSTTSEARETDEEPGICGKQGVCYAEEPGKSASRTSERYADQAGKRGKGPKSKDKPVTSYGGTFAVSKDVAPLPSPEPAQKKPKASRKRSFTSTAADGRHGAAGGITVGTDGNPELPDGTPLSVVRDPGGEIFYRAPDGTVYNSEGVPAGPPAKEEAGTPKRPRSAGRGRRAGSPARKKGRARPPCGVCDASGPCVHKPDPPRRGLRDTETLPQIPVPPSTPRTRSHSPCGVCDDAGPCVDEKMRSPCGVCDDAGPCVDEKIRSPCGVCDASGPCVHKPDPPRRDRRPRQDRHQRQDRHKGRGRSPCGICPPRDRPRQAPCDVCDTSGPCAEESDRSDRHQRQDRHKGRSPCGICPPRDRPHQAPCDVCDTSGPCAEESDRSEDNKASEHEVARPPPPQPRTASPCECSGPERRNATPVQSPKRAASTCRTVAISTRMVPKTCPAKGKSMSAPGTPSATQQKDPGKRPIRSADDTQPQAQQKAQAQYQQQKPCAIYHQYSQKPCLCGQIHYKAATAVVEPAAHSTQTERQRSPERKDGSTTIRLCACNLSTSDGKTDSTSGEKVRKGEFQCVCKPESAKRAQSDEKERDKVTCMCRPAPIRSSFDDKERSTKRPPSDEKERDKVICTCRPAPIRSSFDDKERSTKRPPGDEKERDEVICMCRPESPNRPSSGDKERRDESLCICTPESPRRPPPERRPPPDRRPPPERRSESRSPSPTRRPSSPKKRPPSPKRRSPSPDRPKDKKRKDVSPRRKDMAEVDAGYGREPVIEVCMQPPLQTISECECETDHSTATSSWGLRTSSDVSTSQLTSDKTEDPSCEKCYDCRDNKCTVHRSQSAGASGRSDLDRSCEKCHICGDIKCTVHKQAGSSKPSDKTGGTSTTADEVQTSETRMIRARDLQKMTQHLPGSTDRFDK